MGQTVGKMTKTKDIDILKRALQKIFNWQQIESLTPEQEKRGERLGGSLYGGVVDENNKRVNYPVVLRVKKENLTNLKGQKATFSDFVVIRSPDGKLIINSDLHNFDPSDKEIFVTDEMIKGVDSGYARECMDTHLQSVETDPVQDWHVEGGKLKKSFYIDEDEIPNIPQVDYL